MKMEGIHILAKLSTYGRTSEGLDFTRPIAAGGMGVVYEMDGAVIQQPKSVAVKFQPISEHPLVPPVRAVGLFPVHVDYEPGRIVVVDRHGRTYQHEVTDQEHLRLQHVIFERQTLKLLEGIEGIVGFRHQQFYVVDGYLFSALFMEHLKDHIPMDYIIPTMDEGGKYHVIAELGDIVRQLGEANIVHKDIKPDNVAVSQNGDVKLLDFGIARMTKYQHYGDDPLDVRVLLTEKMRKEGIACGTVGYLSPEEARCQPVTPHSDTFSYGMTSAHVLNGQRVSFAKEDVLYDLFLRTIGYDESDRQRALMALRFQGIPEDVVVAVGRAINPNRKKRRYGPLLRAAEERQGWNGPYGIVLPENEKLTVAQKPGALQRRKDVDQRAIPDIHLHDETLKVASPWGDLEQTLLLPPAA